ncbi:MAG: flagellar filament capping protein FliD [Bacteroidota bacterium]
MLLGSSASAFRESDPYEILIQQLLIVESQPRVTLEDSKFNLERDKSVLNDLDSRVSALDSILDSFLDPLTHPFNSRTVNLSDTTGFSAKASDDAVFGSHSIQVDRLASTDTRLSDRYTAANTDIVTALGTGTKSFSISVSNPTDADPDNRETIAVSVDISNSDDETVLQEVASAINAAMNSAYDAETIEGDSRATASVVKETSDSARISIRAGDTGYTSRINFESDTDGLLSYLGVSNASVVSGASGGQAAFVGTSEDTSDLTSQFDLNGLTLYRNSNSVNDAITGVTLTLNETMTSPIDFSVVSDSSSIEADVQDFIDKYNDILSHIKTRAVIDGETGERGTFAGDTTFTSLRFNMRTDVIQEVSGQPNDAPSQITDIGIEVSSDGSLRLDDADALIQAIEADPENVRTLFAGTDGVATRLSNRISDYLGFGGFIQSREENIDTRIRTLDGRITRFDESLSRREEQLRGEFARLQEAITLFEGQQASLFAFG